MKPTDRPPKAPFLVLPDSRAIGRAQDGLPWGEGVRMIKETEGNERERWEGD
jgi:hypothetical protein